MINSKPTLLMIDDDMDILDSYYWLLEDSFDIKVATTAQEGLKLVKENNFQIIVTDFKMPEMDGIEFLTLVQDISPDSIRILLTGYIDKKTANEAVEKGNVFKYINKPCDFVTFTSILKEALDSFSQKK